MKTGLRGALTVSLALWRSISFSHEVPVHRQITENAIGSALTYSSGFTGFLDTVSADCTIADANNFIALGSEREDDTDLDTGGKRSYNHFYDPLTGRGLSEIPPFNQRRTVGTNSFTWASISNCAALNLNFHFFGLGNNLNKSNKWSWQNARGYEWVGLTAASRSERFENLTDMFRAVGQVVHLLEDTTQPQHVRNEQHANWHTNDEPTLWSSPIESFGKKHYLALNYQHGMLQWRTNGFTKLEDFWNRHIYDGSSSQPLVNNAGGSQPLGLAEFVDGNFLGARHLFPEYFSPGDLQYYPFPSRDRSTDYKSVRANPASGLHTVILDNGHQGKGIYLHKNADGIDVQYISRINYLGAKIPKLTGTPFCTINDSNVLQNYHSILIPKAVQYSAGLLDYFFRGRLQAQLNDTNAAVWQIANVSEQELRGGSFKLFYEDPTGLRSEVSTNNYSLTYSSPLATNATMDLSITDTSMLEPGGFFILVYKGTIGGGTDPVDDGNAIAAVKLVTPKPSFSQMEWESAVTQADPILVPGHVSTAQCNGNGFVFVILTDESPGGSVQTAAATATGTLHYSGTGAQCVLSFSDAEAAGGSTFSISVSVNSTEIVSLTESNVHDTEFAIPFCNDAEITVQINITTVSGTEPSNVFLQGGLALVQ